MEFSTAHQLLYAIVKRKVQELFGQLHHQTRIEKYFTK